MEAALKNLLRQKVTVRPYVGVDRYNKPTYGTAVTYDARVTFRQRLIRAADGQEKMSSGEVWLDGSATLGTLDELTLPDGKVPLLLRVDRLADEAGGTHHVKAYLA